MYKLTQKKQKKILEKHNNLLNYFSVAQIFLDKNFLLEKDLEKEDIKKRLLGHWGTCPGISFVYSHINRQIKILEEKNKDFKTKKNKKFFFTVGTGHGFPAYQSGIFFDGVLSKFFPKKIPYTKKGFDEVIKNFSTPYGYPSHLNPDAPGTILEGGELGYSLSVAVGSVLDNPEYINFCLIGDGEAETGPLAASWNFNRFLSPKKDGAVLPILHLNGYKISGPTIFGKKNDIEIKKYFKSLGYKPYFIDYNKKKNLQIQGMEVFDKAIERIEKIQKKSRDGEKNLKPKWPVVILKTPKGMGCPKEIEGKKIEGNFASHQVVFENLKEEKNLNILQNWLKSYKIENLISFEKSGKIVLDKDIEKNIPELKNTFASDDKANSKNLEKLKLPKSQNFFSDQEIFEKKENASKENSMYYAGKYLSETISKNDNLRIFSPDETYSNKLQEVFKNTKRQWQWPTKDFDKDFGESGKVIEILSEHFLFGMLWGYTLTGRHGFFVTYEAFATIVSSMADQYVKFLHASKDTDFRGEVPSLNVILSSLLERQDHNGYSHQNPSFIASNLDRDLDLVNVYFPADKNLMTGVLEKVLVDKNSLNIIVAGKKMTRTFLNKKECQKLLKDEIGIFDSLSDKNPDVVVATAGDYATEEAVVGLQIFRKYFPKIKVRFINFLKLDILSENNKNISNKDILKKYLTEDKGIVFNYHGYPSSVKKLLFDYHISERIVVNGYCEEGSTTSPFDMKARNGLSRFHLVKDLAKMAEISGKISKKEIKDIEKKMDRELKKEKEYIIENKVDPDYIKNW